MFRDGPLSRSQKSGAQKHASRKKRVRRRSKLVPLVELVKKAHPVPSEVDFARILAWWCAEMPPRIATRARPARLKHHVLWVHTVSSTWAQELSFMTEDLLSRVTEAGLGIEIRVIRFRTGRLPPAPRPRGQKLKNRDLPLTTDLPETIGRALAAIGDDDVRRAVHQAAATAMEAEKRRKSASDRALRQTRKP